MRLQDFAAPTSNEFKAQAVANLQALDALRVAERWTELRAQAAAHRDFYRNEAETMRRRHVEARALALRREHYLRQSAAQLVAELQQLPPSNSRDSALQQLVAKEAAALATAVTHAVELVGAHRTRAEDPSLKHIRTLAAAYADPAIDSSPPPALPRAEADPNEIRLQKCCALLAELETLPAASLVDLQEQAARAAAASADERSLLLDSLALNLTSLLRQCREQQAAVAAARSVLTDLESVSSPECAAWRSRLEAALASSRDTAELQAMTASARHWLQEEIARADVAAQRAAVLQALAALGYEVREGMVTAWSEHGQVIVHKPQDPIYGLELSAAPMGSNFQVRVVAVGEQSRSKQRDLEVEQSWCGEFTRLQSLLAAEGFASKLAHASAPGTIPLKTVPALRRPTEPHQTAFRQRSHGS